MKAQCRFNCPRRAQCAADALNSPNPVGVIAGIYIPPKLGTRRGCSRAQDYARTRLAVIAALGSTR